MFHARVVYKAMRHAINLAQSTKEEMPVAALLIDRSGNIVASAVNSVEKSGQPIEHAECNVLRDAAARFGYRNLGDFALIVTWEPCDMCTSVCALYRVRHVFFGANHSEKKYNYPSHWIGGIYEQEIRELLRGVFGR